MENDASKIFQKVKDKRDNEFSPSFDVMDENFAIWAMESGKTSADSTIYSKTQGHGSEIDIISNDLRAFSDIVQSTLSSSERQIMVTMAEAEGKDARSEIGRLERLFHFLLKKADERLGRMLLPTLEEMTDWQALVRGCRAARILLYKAGKDVIPDFIAPDPRWLVYEVGGEGLLWVGHTTFKSKAMLKSEQDYDATKEKDIEVCDYWEYLEEGKVANSIICEGDFIKKPEILKIPSMPFAIRPVSTRPPVSDSTGTKLKGYGESLFAAGRGINSVRNRFISIVANHANKLANQPLFNYRDAQGKSLGGEILPGGIVDLDRDHQRVEASPMNDIPQAVLGILDWLNGQMEQVMLPKIPIGPQGPSGTAYNLAQEQGTKIFNPQLRNKQSFYEDVCRLIEEQIIAGGIYGDLKKVKVQGVENKKYYETSFTPVDLKKPHIIEVKFTARTPWSQYDTTQVAQMLIGQGLPRLWVWEHILKIQDPKLLQDLVALETYEQSPQGMMKRAVEVLKDKGYEFEADKLVEQMDLMEAQEAQMGVPAEGGLNAPGQ